MFSTHSILLAGLGGLGLCASTMGAINPFTETFSSSAANWSTTSPAFSALTYVPSGGLDGSAYGSASFGFASSSNGAFVNLFWGQQAFGASGNAFVGNWFTAGVTTMTFDIRHNAPGSLDFFGRFTAVGSPTGAAYLEPAVVPAGTWTTLTIPIGPFNSPFWVAEGPPTLFNSTFSNVGNVQVGVMVDPTLAGQAGPFTIDIDNVSITPAPGAGAAMLGVLAVGLVRRRR